MDKSDLHKYQHTCYNHILENDSCALFLEMGLGKTVTTLTAINTLIYEDLEINNAFIIAPKRVAENVWHTEIEKWAHLRHLTISIVSGNIKHRKLALAAKADIYVIGRDNVAWLCGLYGGSMLPTDMVVIDELSSFKNSKSVRFKSLKNVMPSVKRVVGLTGTPAPNGLIDLWAQMYLLDKGERLGKFITQFRREYFSSHSPTGVYTKYNITKKDEKRIHEKIGDICISMKAKDYLDLPEYIFNDIDIKFSDKLQKKYDDFEKEQVLALFEDNEDEVISVTNAAALSNKLLQFANGAVYDEDKNWHMVHDLKMEALKEIIEDANGKSILIAWTYRHDMYRMKEGLKKYKPRELKTSKDIDDWNAGKIQVMMMHPASGGHGLNLQNGGHIVVWFGQTWSLELYQQLNARLKRQGQKFAVVVNRLIASKTMDQDVIRSLSKKHKSQDGVMSAVRARIEKYIMNR